MLTLSFVYLAIGIILSNFIYFARRNRESRRSPVKFDFKFWLRDNYIKILHSVVTAVALDLLFNLHPDQTTTAMRHIPFIPVTFEWLPIFSFFLGFFPDQVLSFLKSRFRWLQQSIVIDSEGTTYNRK